MGSSWRYRHVAITPYSIGGFHVLTCMFFTDLLVLFQGLAFCFDGQAREFTGRWRATGWHRIKQKNKLAQSAGSTIFSQHFPTQASPHYIQLDPIYYVYFQKFRSISPWLLIIYLLCFYSLLDWNILQFLKVQSRLENIKIIEEYLTKSNMKT